MAYIANRPVRFDRNYQVGEIIPPEVIEPKMVRKLIEMGRILCVDIPATRTGAGEVPGVQQESTESTKDINIHTDSKTPSKGQNEAPAKDFGAVGKTNVQETPSTQQEGAGTEEYVCPVCGKSFGSKNALSAHSRTHRE